MSLHEYLQKHFIDKPSFASLAGISEDRLDQLIDARAVPSATYICDGTSVRSAVFGTTPIHEQLEGEYFRPECARWVRIAADATKGSEREAVFAVLINELRSALKAYLNSSADIEEKIQGFLPHFSNGTFGLCVADPSSGACIVRKEMLQEKLTELTENGSNPCPVGICHGDLLELIDDYARSSMHFSPAEYERSSRKRLVDGLRAMVAKA